MATSITKYKIFLASPSDLTEEREAVKEVIEELNMSPWAKNKLTIELVRWETHSTPGATTEHPQALINTELGEDYDLFIGMLWTKFGTPTLNANSGTEEEFDIAFKRFTENSGELQIMFYFKSSSPPLNSIDPDELKKVLAFKKRISENILYSEFDSVENLKKYLRINIPGRIDDIARSSTVSGPTISSKTVVETPSSEDHEDEDELGLYDYIDEFAYWLGESTHSLTAISEATAWIGDEISERTKDISRANKAPNHNPNIIRGILKQAANSMMNYTLRIKNETPIFYTNFEHAIEDGTGLLNLIADFNSEENITALEGLKKSVFELKGGILKGISGTESFLDSVISLPRLEKTINAAKRNMANELRVLIERLYSSLRLAEGFSTELSHKIDQLKLENS